MFCLAWEALVCNRAPEVSHVFSGLSCGAQGTFPGAGHQWEQRQHEEGCWGEGLRGAERCWHCWWGCVPTAGAGEGSRAPCPAVLAPGSLRGAALRGQELMKGTVMPQEAPRSKSLI